MSRGQRIPGDDLTDVLQSINDGLSIPEADDDGDDIPADESATREESTPAYVDRREPPSDIPVAILDVLKSPERQELIEMAQLLRRSQDHTKTMLFLTPLGDIKCTVNWMSCRPSEINSSSMFFVKTRANSLAFIPKPGAVFDIAFEDNSNSVKVICLVEPQRIYPGVDLLCFMPHNQFMEKTGQLKEEAPSVVSGKPSTHVVDGEPVAEGEQPMRKEAFNRASTASQDFDKFRPL